MLSRRTRRGELLHFAYDALGRLVQKQVPERTSGPDALAATHTSDVFYGYDLKGRPVHARFDSHTGEGLAFAYDALDRMTSTTQDLEGAADGPPRTLGYGYDTTGQLNQLTHPDGQYLRYVNDRLGRTSEVWRDTTHKLVAWVYNKPGQLTQQRNGTTTDFAYLADGRFASLTLNAAGTSQDNVLSATFNAAGQIASRSQSNDAFAFTGSGNFDHGYLSNGLNQYAAVQGITHSYDVNGNLTGDGTNTWVYDVENRLVSARGLYAANLRYDPLGRLHETVTNVDDGIPANDITVRRLYDGGALVAEYDQTGALLRRYVHGPNTGADTPLVWYEGPTMSQAAARMLNTDLQGSVTSVTDFNGAPLGINRYDEYGRPQSGNVGRFQYTGQAWLPEIGLYYYKARMYSPTLGRFMQTDPIGYADGVNWYNYVGGDPVNGVDPSGLSRDDHPEDWQTWPQWMRQSYCDDARSIGCSYIDPTAEISGRRYHLNSSSLSRSVRKKLSMHFSLLSLLFQRDMDGIVVMAQRNPGWFGIDFGLKYPAEQLWVFTDNQSFGLGLISVPVMQEMREDSCGNPLGLNFPDPNFTMPSSVVALLHTHPGWAASWPAAGDFQSSRRYDVYGIFGGGTDPNGKPANGAWVLRRGTLSPQRLFGSSPATPQGKSGASCAL